MNEQIMQLIQEEGMPDEMFLENMVEETVEFEDEIISGVAESDEAYIEFIAADGRMQYDDDVNFAAFDDLDDEDEF